MTSTPLTILKLGVIVTDKVTGVKGMLTHLQISLDHSRIYHFAPRGVNPKDGQPVQGSWMVDTRFPDAPTEDIDVPMYLLGTKAKDRASGFTGIIIDLIVHLNGCVHANIKPKGIVKETGGTVAAYEFDLRRLEGEAIQPLKEPELKASKVRHPSPAPASTLKG